MLTEMARRAPKLRLACLATLKQVGLTNLTNCNFKFYAKDDLLPQHRVSMEKSEDETNTDNNAYNSIRDDTIDDNIYEPKSSCKGIEN